MIMLKPVVRRIVYVCTFEIFAIALSTVLLMLMSGGDAAGSAPIAVAVSLIALTWNYIFNSFFEMWERKTLRSERTLGLRVVHALGFEVGLFIFTIPLYMWWYSVGPWVAFKMEAAILLFFLIFTFLFTWVFDRIFALPCDSEGLFVQG